MPAAAFVMSPWVDLTLSGNTIIDKQDFDPTLTGEGFRRRRRRLRGRRILRTPTSARYSQIYGLPPMLIQVGSHEILLSDAVRLADRAANGEVAVTLEVGAGVPHVFQAYAACSTRATRR